ncbi:MAG TPA: cupredoxin domain-containing protein [Solirubrobacterales bacterium]
MTTSLQRPRFWFPAALAALSLTALFAVNEGDAAEPSAGASAAKTVSIKNFAFQPATLRVNRGARVAFTNTSNAAHTATKSGSFDTARIAPGKTKTIQFNQRGSFAYHCKIHPFMKGKVVVE